MMPLVGYMTPYIRGGELWRFEKRWYKTKSFVKSNFKPFYKTNDKYTVGI